MARGAGVRSLRGSGWHGGWKRILAPPRGSAAHLGSRKLVLHKSEARRLTDECAPSEAVRVDVLDLGGVWRPRKYDDIRQAIGVAEEGPQLDFKRELASGSDKKDLAKDAAAMGVDGGVILIGVDENQNAVASGIPKVPVKGTPEQVQQIIDSRVRPPLSIQIEVLKEADLDPDGVLLIEIPPSFSTPHMVDNRYPARSGSTTRWLEETEVASLYERRQLAPGAGGGVAGMDDFVAPEGIASPFRPNGIGVLSVHIRPLVDVGHPDEPRLLQPLARSVQEASAALAPLIASQIIPRPFDFLRSWKARGTIGFRAGSASQDFEQLKDVPMSAATFIYRGGFSFRSTMSTLTEDGSGRVAMEHLWATDLMACLSIAGNFYLDIPAASLLRVDLSLDGLAGAASWRDSWDRVAPDAPRVVDDAYSAGGVFGARELATDPSEATRILLDRFFVSFIHEGHDVVGSLRERVPI